MSRKYLVTGGCGFIGSHIANKLNAMGKSVRVLDFAPKANLDDGIEFIQGDIRHDGVVASAMKGVDYVLHQAAIPSVPRSIKNPVYTNECNVSGTLNLLIAAVAERVRRFVYASSSSVYGDQANPKREDMMPMPKSPYAVSKYTGELYCNSFREVYGLPVTILRYFNVYGPGQKFDNPYSAVIPNFLSAAMNGHRAVIYGDGTQSRDFTYVEDVVNANLLACEQTGPGGCFNVATGVATSVNDLFRVIGELSGKHVDFRRDIERTGDVRHSYASTKMALESLGFTAFVTLETGLGRMWAYVHQSEDR